VAHSGADFYTVDYTGSQCSQWVSCLLCLWPCHFNLLHTVCNVLTLSTRFILIEVNQQDLSVIIIIRFVVCQPIQGFNVSLRGKKREFAGVS
jgi:hypothetical protein